MLRLRKSDNSNLAPLKQDTSPRVDCRNLFSPEYRAMPLSPTEGGLARRDQYIEHARESTQDVMLRGLPLPLTWVCRGCDFRLPKVSPLMLFRCLCWTTLYRILPYHSRKRTVGLSSLHGHS